MLQLGSTMSKLLREVRLPFLISVAVALTAFCVDFLLARFGAPPGVMHIWLGPLIAMMIAFPFAFYISRQMQKLRVMGALLEQQVSVDDLTGIGSRRAFFQHMSDTRNRTGVLLLMDLDRFKSFNDTFGHSGGDEVLRRVGQTLRDNCRDHDIVARFGGEEFVVFFDGVDLHAGAMLADRMSQAVRAIDLPTAMAAENIELTISGGWVYKSAHADLQRLLSDADRALYTAKEAGRDRMYCSAPDGCVVPNSFIYNADGPAQGTAALH